MRSDSKCFLHPSPHWPHGLSLFSLSRSIRKLIRSRLASTPENLPSIRWSLTMTKSTASRVVSLILYSPLASVTDRCSIQQLHGLSSPVHEEHKHPLLLASTTTLSKGWSFSSVILPRRL